MPLLKIQTNISLDAKQQRDLLSDASQRIASTLGKPEQYVMVLIETDRPMVFAASVEPTAFVELRSIGLPQDRTPALSEMLCGLLHHHIGVTGDRVFINFADVPRASWGWNGRTF